jgi:hypothetical protein
MAELEAAGLADAGAVVAGGGAVLMICIILKVPVLAGTAVLLSGVGALGVGCSGAAGVACPGEVGAGLVQTSGTSGAFLLSMPAPTSSAVLAPLALAPVSGVS